MPHSIRYRCAEDLEDAKRIMNGHPQLTVFVRDRETYAYAAEHFVDCRVLLTPDSVVHLAGHWLFETSLPSSEPILYLRRTDDWDVARRFAPEELGLDGVAVAD